MADQREQLIEKAAKAILDEAGVLPSERYDEMWELARRDARAALAVFEEANTPTDDEREALADVLDDCLQSLTDTRGICYPLADAALAAGFHRTEQGEPKHTKGCIDWCNHCQVCGEAIKYGSRCPSHYLNQVQGEPSDARIRQAVLDGLAEASVLQSPFTPQLRELAVERITAALRAAAATERGEGR